MGQALPDMYHFMLLFSTFLMAFAVMAHGFFGTTLYPFSNILECLQTCFIRTLGGLSLPDLTIAANSIHGQVCCGIKQICCEIKRVSQTTSTDY